MLKISARKMLHPKMFPCQWQWASFLVATLTFTVSEQIRPAPLAVQNAAAWPRLPTDPQDDLPFRKVNQSFFSCTNAAPKWPAASCKGCFSPTTCPAEVGEPPAICLDPGGRNKTCLLPSLSSWQIGELLNIELVSNCQVNNQL